MILNQKQIMIENNKAKLETKQKQNIKHDDNK